VYSVESEDCKIEIVFFVPVNEDERDPNVQLVFVKGKYYSICGKVVPGTYNCRLRLKMTAVSSTHLTIRRDLGSNRCPLKASLVGVVQDIPEKVNDESAMLKLLVNDYAVRPSESVLFVVGHMEVIQEDLYVYAANTSYVENVNEKSSKASSTEADKYSVDLTIDDSRSLKCVRSDIVEGEDSCIEDEEDLVRNVGLDYNYCDQIVEHNKEHAGNSDEREVDVVNEDKVIMRNYRKGNKGKERVTQPIMHNTRSQARISKDVNKKD
ncbi:33462_t:CDS:2, partial [Racocetra persica]